MPGSSVRGIFQAIVLEWIAISFSRGSSQPRAWTQVSHIVDRRFTLWATREVCKWVIIPLWLSGSLRSFLYSSSMYSCHLFLISSASIRSFPHSSVGKESACNARDPGLIPGSGRSAGEGIGYPLQCSWASLVAQLVKNLPAVQETWVLSLGLEDPLKKGKATHSSILAWRIPWTV